MLDSFVNKTEWKLIPSQNVGMFLDVFVKANPGIIDFKMSRPAAFVLTLIYREKV